MSAISNKLRELADELDASEDPSHPLAAFGCVVASDEKMIKITAMGTDNPEEALHFILRALYAVAEGAPPEMPHVAEHRAIAAALDGESSPI
jgi:hypothetical protein